MPLGLGLLITCTAGCYYGLSIKESHVSDGLEKVSGLTRYGFGYGGITIGTGVGIDLESNSGFIMMSKGPIKLGAELGGSLRLNTNPLVYSYYEWRPGLGVGTTAGPVLFWLKGGADISNRERSDVLPDPRLYVAASAEANYDIFSGGVEARLVGTKGAAYSFTLLVGKEQRVGVNFNVSRIESAGSITLQKDW